MNHQIITIGRQFGSGGRTIAKKIAEALGIPYYDAALIQSIAQKSGFTADYIKEEGEYAPYGFAALLSNRTMGGNSQDNLWLAQREVILELAQKSSCVIVGRCADYILKDTVDCLTVFIHADLAHRARRIVSEYGERHESPEQRLKEKDKGRAAYYRFYTEMKWGYADHYHLCLDSGKFGIDRCAQIIISLYQQNETNQ